MNRKNSLYVNEMTVVRVYMMGIGKYREGGTGGVV